MELITVNFSKIDIIIQQLTTMVIYNGEKVFIETGENALLKALKRAEEYSGVQLLKPIE